MWLLKCFWSRGLLCFQFSPAWWGRGTFDAFLEWKHCFHISPALHCMHWTGATRNKVIIAYKFGITSGGCSTNVTSTCEKNSSWQVWRDLSEFNSKLVEHRAQKSRFRIQDVSCLALYYTGIPNRTLTRVHLCNKCDRNLLKKKIHLWLLISKSTANRLITLLMAICRHKNYCLLKCTIISL